MKLHKKIYNLVFSQKKCVIKYNDRPNISFLIRYKFFNRLHFLLNIMYIQTNRHLKKYNFFMIYTANISFVQKNLFYEKYIFHFIYIFPKKKISVHTFSKKLSNSLEKLSHTWMLATKPLMSLKYVFRYFFGSLVQL